MNNQPFVQALKKEQERQKMTQAEFSRHIGVSQGALSKFYSRGVKDGVVTGALAKFPHLVRFFAPNKSSRN